MNDLSNKYLTEKKCQPYKASDSPLNAEQLNTYLTYLHQDWSLSDNNKIVMRTVRFKNYHQTMAFVNAVAWIAHQQDHHPDMQVCYNLCIIKFSTHTIDGLSLNDFICAAKVDALLT